MKIAILAALSSLAVLLPLNEAAAQEKYALAIGITGYPLFDEYDRLRFADDDAQLFFDFITSEQGGGFPKENVRLLLNKSATREGMAEAIEWLGRRAGHDDLAYVFFSGHGIFDDGLEQGYLMPFNANPRLPTAAAFTASEFLKIIHQKVNSKFLIIFIDACHSGAVADGLIKGGTANVSRAFDRAWEESYIREEAMRMFFLSASANQSSYEDPQLGGGHGLFTWYLIQGLRGAADDTTDAPPDRGRITAGELYRYLLDEVEDHSRRVFGKTQSPIHSPSYSPTFVLGITEAFIDTSVQRRPGDSVKDRLTVAYNLAQAGAYSEAIALLQEGIAENSSSAALWEYLGDIALKKATAGDNLDEEAARIAIDAYKHLLALRGDRTEVSTLKNTIAAYMALDEVDAAIDFSERALQQIPDSASLWSVRADALARAERFEEATESMDHVLALDPSYPTANLRRGIFKLRAGDEDGAVTDFRKAIAAGSDPNKIASRLLARGYGDYFQKAQYSEAIDLFTTGLEFATSAEMMRQLNFFTGAAYFQRGFALDESNGAEACAPAQRALVAFQKVHSYMDQAGSYQAANKAQIVEETDVYIDRQQRIIRKAC